MYCFKSFTYIFNDSAFKLYIMVIVSYVTTFFIYLL